MKPAVSLGTPTPQGKDAFRRASAGAPDALTSAGGDPSGSQETRENGAKSVKSSGSTGYTVASASSRAVTSQPPPTPRPPLGTGSGISETSKSELFPPDPKPSGTRTSHRRSPLGDVSNVSTTPDDTAAKLHRGWGSGSFHASPPDDEKPDRSPALELAERALSTANGLRDLSQVLSPAYASPGIVDGAHGDVDNELDRVYGRYKAHAATRTPGFAEDDRPKPASWATKRPGESPPGESPPVAFPAGAAVTLAHALGRWREASSVSAVRSVAKREKDQLTTLLREQADACDAEVNALTAEIEDLMEALAESGSESSRLRWRWSARAGVLAERCDGYRREANRLRAKASGLESQLSSVEAHIADAAKDFEVLREKLNESRRETERARAGEDEARRQLVAAQAAAADAIAAAAMVAASPNAIRVDVSNDAMREAMRKQLKEELRAEVEREVRNEMGTSGRDASADVHALSGSVARSVESLLHGGKSAQVRQLSAARMEATQRCSSNLAAMRAAGVETLKLDEDESRGGVESAELISLIAAHALQRCEAHPHGDGARAFYRAARRVELAAMACQPQYKKRDGRRT